jgi:hypothetical protein
LNNAAEPSSDLYVGENVAISGDGTTVLLSDDWVNHNTGGAYVFHAASEGTWATSSTPTAILSDGSGAKYDYLGGTLALSGDGTTAFLAAHGVNGYRGAVDVFHVADAASWASNSTPTATLTNGGGAANDALGSGLTASADGTTVMAGALGVGKHTGATYVFHASAEDAWTSTASPNATLTNAAGGHGDYRGSPLASSADGATVLVSAPSINWDTGSVDVFHVADAGSWVTNSTPTGTLTNSALPKPLCVVPNVLKERLSDVKFDLDLSNCTLGKVKKVHSAKKNRKKVVAQSPRPGRRLRPGSKVNLKVGK